MWDLVLSSESNFWGPFEQNLLEANSDSINLVAEADFEVYLAVVVYNTRIVYCHYFQK